LWNYSYLRIFLHIFGLSAVSVGTQYVLLIDFNGNTEDIFQLIRIDFLGQRRFRRRLGSPIANREAMHPFNLSGPAQQISQAY
jgi:hypothetical protein